MPGRGIAMDTEKVVCRHCVCLKCLEAGWKTSWHTQRRCSAGITMRLRTMEFHSHQERRRCIASVNLLACVCTSCSCYTSCEGFLFSVSPCTFTDLQSFDWWLTKNKKTKLKNLVGNSAIDSICIARDGAAAGISTIAHTHTHCVLRQNVSALTANRLSCFVGGIHLMRLKVTFRGFVMATLKLVSRVCVLGNSVTYNTGVSGRPSAPARSPSLANARLPL